MSPEPASTSGSTPVDWETALFHSLQSAGVRQLPFVPDAGHAKLIRLAEADPLMRPVVLTTEEEGVALACGAWLGGEKAVLLMQSSGVGNTINMLSLIGNCQFPLVTLVTMRGEFGEFNPWQVPMSRATETGFAMMGLAVHRCERPEQVSPTVEAALYAAFEGNQASAILLGQQLIGRKEW